MFLKPASYLQNIKLNVLMQPHKELPRTVVISVLLYVGHFKSSAHCACATSRMMQSFWFSRQLWARLQSRTVCAYWQATWSLFCKTEPWNGRRIWSQISRSDQRSSLRRGLMPQVQYRKFGESMDGKCYPTRRTVLTWAHQYLTCSQNWRNYSVGNVSEALRSCVMRWHE